MSIIRGGESESLLNVYLYLWIFNCAQVCPPVVNSIFLFSMSLLIKFKTLMNNLNNFKRSIIMTLLAIFSHQRLQVISHWSSSNRQFPQVSRSLLSILSDINNAAIRMILIRHQILNTSSPLTNHLGPIQMHQLQLVSPLLSWSIAFLVLWLDLSTCLSFSFLCFSTGSQPSVHLKSHHPKSCTSRMCTKMTNKHHQQKLRATLHQRGYSTKLVNNGFK